MLYVLICWLFSADTCYSILFSCRYSILSLSVARHKNKPWCSASQGCSQDKGWQEEGGGGGFCVIIRKHWTVHNVTGTRIWHKRSELLCSALQRHAVSHYNKTGVSILPKLFGFIPVPRVSHTRLCTPQLNVVLSKAGGYQIVLSIYRNGLSCTQLCATLSLVHRLPL
jgi:hypothetical protein